VPFTLTATLFCGNIMGNRLAVAAVLLASSAYAGCADYCSSVDAQAAGLSSLDGDGDGRACESEPRGGWADVCQFSSAGPSDEVIDGDSLILDGVEYRLLGVDAPESDQPGGREATDRLREIEIDRCEGEGVDRYGRVLAICYSGLLNVNRILVVEGLVWPYMADPLYLVEWRNAQQFEYGLWADDTAIDPAEWRRR